MDKKNKIQPYATWKTPAIRTHTDWKGRDGKTFHSNRKQKKAGVTVLIANKIAFKSNTGPKRQRSLYNDKGVNLIGGYNICKYLLPNIGISKAYIYEPEGRNRITVIVRNFNTHFQ